METEKELFLLKPSILNAVVPIFAKNLFYAILIGGVAFGLYWLIETFGTIDYSMNKAIFWLITFLIVFPTIPSLFKLLILYNTKYIFYKTYIVSEFELLRVKRHSTPYNQIVNISNNVSIWDRFCKAGDVILHTAEDRLPDLTLFYIKNPESIEAKLYQMVRDCKNEKNIHSAEVVSSEVCDANV